ncbi:M20/M25/M40 family metallo-hydrolase [Halomarina oriensis]|uniref:M20/M25/M40 family metallo-hydrolase n=1 Tax=Halomarina oriensis TaxID=671145 RepID=A0A6B0GTJ5_9EURY|nr:M20/M25/M40 family metallo-hydrolase [Halomarina oriensis]
MTKRPELTDLTRRLVATPSHDDETAAGAVIADWLHDHTDATVEHDPEGAGVVARKGDPDAANRVALVGHHDVVAPDASQVTDDALVVEERTVEREDGREEPRLFGRGSADMKGAVAAAMVAFRDADAPCTFASFRGEERGGVGARHAIEEGFRPDYAIVAEGSTNYSKPGVTDVVVAHKGRRGSTVTARGTAAHASEPDRGENAIYRAAEAVELVRDLDTPEAEVLGVTQSGTVAVTEIEGGSGWNVIPEACSFTVDERTVAGERAPLAQVEAIDGVSWTVDQDLPPMACADDEFAEAVLAAAVDAQAGTPELVSKPHATDAGWLAGAGTTCVVCGASEPGEAHTRDESVSLAVLDRCERIYRGAVERVAAFE